MNPVRLVKAFVSESVRAVCEVVIPPLVGRLITGFAEGGDTRLWVEPDPPRNPGARPCAPKCPGRAAVNATKFRKKPVVIEAMQLPDNPDRGRTVAETNAILAWIGTNEGVARTRAGCVFIQTLEGDMQASPGDWIIRGVQGEFYPCKPDIFAATYEAVQA